MTALALTQPVRMVACIAAGDSSKERASRPRPRAAAEHLELPQAVADDVWEAQQEWRVHAALAQQAHDLVHIHRLAAGCRPHTTISDSMLSRPYE